MRTLEPLEHPVVDLHAHVLPGLDDGPASLAESLELLRASRAAGVTRIAATPHVRDDHPTEVTAMERAVLDVRAAAEAEGIPVEVLPGGELSLSRVSRFDDETLRRFGLGGNPSLLLVETPYAGWSPVLADLVFHLALRGFRVVLAHPERNAAVQAKPSLLEPLVRAGTLVQLTAGSLDGRFGRRAQRCAETLLAAGAAHLLASDAHAAALRGTGFAAAAAAVGQTRLVRWLTLDVPVALLAGAPLPARPQRQRARVPRAAAPGVPVAVQL
ncbi:MAG TPA: CpsB/CapC family capsule biosynthesis tyrosine phosphatase [Gaiellaceae bacterium]|nr:CpsB/CapC family capsule biosynthesis tyrosine phosphatase [Gaiellaceae bacterium]